ncbi:MAG: hypothetical protein GFH27_549303n63 [Chloroflexi bacterium AL-W]|nr:hypothetical protein [Chloroflexi bacterium AL-N1]NOK67948.1 hypothetical protein [Chloroflexi bacterium AL-N10]NOK73288.1 hypothetical protein [Chloroflexi bacterium AL-N5]NOK83202.1 hypothetical protein [Chloroflexi bacterium AL-W]NOK87619.1 hypothetical protein [Chloroflexi bacterium AL-N15]
MQRYLLFDSGCSVCTGLASKIEEESNGWLTACSLRDTDMQILLNNTQSKWNWEPTLIEVSDTRVCIFTGFKMRSRIALGLGIRRSWKITRPV